MKDGSLLRIKLPGLAVLVVSTLLSACSKNNNTTDLRILWTNDTHGYLSPLYHREEGDDQFVGRAIQEGKVGGFSYIASIVNRQRKELPNKTILVDSGDTWHGTVVPLRLSGTPVVEVMNAMGYDAMVPGNVEMFYDQAILEQLFSAAKFSVVAANIYDAEWGERARLPNTKPYIIKNVKGLKVGIIGMTYHWNSKVSVQPQWSFGLRTEEVQADINKLRNEDSVDLVVMLSHMGWEVDAKYAELVSGIDVIVGAHTHDILYRPTLVYNEKSQRDVIVVQSGSHGKMLGQLDLKVANKRVKAFEQTLFPIRASDIKPDPTIDALIKEFREPYEKELTRVIGETETLLYRQGLWQSTADNLVTDAIREQTGKQVAITEPGKYGATILPGKITVEDIYNLVPMESPIYHMKFSGKDLRTMLEGAIDNVIAGNVLEQVGSNMWRYSGIEMSVDLSKPYLQRIQHFQVDGKPGKDDQFYSLAEFNMFLRNTPLAIDIRKTNQIGPHEIIKFIEKQGKVAPVLDKRLTDHHGNIMSDHAHLHDDWHKSGRDEVDLDNAELYRYRGELDKNNRLVVNRE